VHKIWKLIEGNSSRDLTYASEALKAMAGIFRFYEEAAYPIYKIQELPVLLHIGFVWSPTIIDFVGALTWHHTSRPEARRRRHFPSWTWVGWTGEVWSPSKFTPTPSLGGHSIGIHFEINPQIIPFEHEDGGISTLKELTELLVALRVEASSDGHIHTSRLLQSNITLGDLQKQRGYLTVPRTIYLCAPAVTREHFRFPEPTNWETGTVGA
jgi:hypothetical protein